MLPSGGERLLVAAAVALLGQGTTGCHRGSVDAGGSAAPAPTLAPRALSGIEVAGCGDVLAGPVCRLGTDRHMRVWIPVAAQDVVLTTPEGPLAAQATSVASAGVRLTFEAPAGVTAITVAASVDGQPARGILRFAELPPEPDWIERVRKLHRAGDAAGAVRMLDEHAAKGDAQDGGQDPRIDAIVQSIRARMALAAGDVPRALALFDRSSRLHEALGEVSSAADDEGVRAYALLEQQSAFGDAHASIDRLTQLSRDYPEEAFAARYYEGELALATGDVRTGLAVLEETKQHAEAVGFEQMTRDAESSMAYALVAVGRVDEAYARLSILDRDAGTRMAPCEHATILLNLGEAALLAREARAVGEQGTPPDPGPPLSQAESLYRSTCLDAQALAGVQLDQAAALLLDGNVAGARALVAKARAQARQLDVLTALTALDIDGRASLAQGDARQALATYRALEARAAGVSRPFEARALEGESRALARTDEVPSALAAIEHAEVVLDEVARSVPLGEGRGAFWWSRARTTAHHVRLLLDAGRVEDALAVARATRVRVRQDLRRVTRQAGLHDAERRRWEDALAEYAHGRDELTAAAKDDWSLSAAALQRASSTRHVRDLALREKLDAVARDVFPPPPPLRRLAIDAGTVALAWFPLESGWAAFRASGGEVHVDRIAASTSPADASQVAATLLATQSPSIEQARRIEWIAFDGLRDVDVHALTLGDAPLITRAPVEYLVDASDATPVASTDAAATSGPVVIVGDPTGALPGARREALAVAQRWDAGAPATLLIGAEATRARVLAAIKVSAFLSFSGHAAYAGADGWDSALLLAGGERLGVADILALSQAPALVVLSGCETGRDGEHAGPRGLSLSDAFIASGARAVVASSRRVRDEDGERMMRALVPALAAHPADAAAALREAQTTILRDAPAVDWSAYRVLVP